MKYIWQKIKKIWWNYWEINENEIATERLHSIDKRWLLYWNFITCMGMVIIFLLITRINDTWITRQNDKYIEETINIIATYMATATKEEYDNITKSIQHDLILSEYNKDIEKFIHYIPNTADYCHTCENSYSSQVFLVCTNTGQLYSLDLYHEEEDPNGYFGGSRIEFAYDEVSQTSIDIIKSPDQRTGYAELRQEHGIVSLHRMKTLFCEDCISDILDTIEHQSMEAFVIFDIAERKFYPIDNGTTVQIGNYNLEIEYRNNNYKITIDYTDK